MLSGNDNLPTGARPVSTVSSGVFSHLSSVRRLSIYHGKLFRELFAQGFIGSIYGLKTMLDFCGDLAHSVICKFMNIADDDKSWRRTAVYVTSTLTTVLIGAIVILECVLVILQALFWMSVAVLGLFIAHNIVHTAILGMANLGREVALSWNSIISAPDVQCREGAGAFERGFESGLQKVAILGAAAIRLIPSALIAAISVPLNPLYMLLNTLLPKLDLEEVRATKKTLLETPEKLSATIDAHLTDVVERIQEDPAIRWVTPVSTRTVATDAVRSVVLSADMLKYVMSNAISNAEREFKALMEEENLSEDPEVIEALASITSCKDKLGTFKGVGSAVLSKFEQVDQTQPASDERKTVIKILKLMESSPSLLDTSTLRESFIDDAGLELYNEQDRAWKRKVASAHSEVQTIITNIEEISRNFLQSPAPIACGG